MTEERRLEVRRETRLPYADPRYQEPTAEEIRAVLKYVGLTGSEAAALLGVKTGRTVRKWTGGEQAMPYSAWRLLLEEYALALDDPERIRARWRRVDAAIVNVAERTLAQRDQPNLDELIELAKQNLETAIRRVIEKHGDAYVHIERGVRQWPDEKAGMMRTEPTDCTTITIDRPEQKSTS